MLQKVFMTSSGKVNLACPACGKVKQADVSQFKNTNQKVKLNCTCACKHKFSVILERRRHIRKDVNLVGNLVFDHQTCPVKIVDISRTGLKVKAIQVLKLNPGDKAVIHFTLDDPSGSKVSKQVIIRKINQKEIGVEFLSKDHYDPYGAYILFHSS
jgi:hypothetical protein